MPVNWGMGVMPDVGANALAAFQQGQAQRKQADAQNALTAYATNPNEASLNALAPYQPEFVMQQKQQMQAKAQKEAEQKLIGDALAHPDPNARQMARQQLAYTNSDLYMKLGAEQKQAVDGLMKAIGQQAFSIMQLPKEKQEGALQQALQGLQAQGIDTSGFHLTGNPDVDLRTALAISGQLDDFEKFAQPDYVPIGEGGLAGFQYGKPIQQGGQVQNFGGPQPGSVVGGYRFKGGNPNDRNSWEPAGGPTQPASGGFRPVGLAGERVTSTVRTAARNRAVGGVPNSYHLSGRARDSVPPPGMSMAAYAAQLKRLNPHLDVINEGDHVHMEPR